MRHLADDKRRMQFRVRVASHYAGGFNYFYNEWMNDMGSGECEALCGICCMTSIMLILEM